MVVVVVVIVAVHVAVVVAIVAVVAVVPVVAAAVAVFSCLACAPFLKSPTEFDAVAHAAAAAAADHQTTVPDSSVVPHAFVLSCPRESRADVHGGAGAVAAVARSAARAACDFVIDAVAGREKAFAAGARSANDGRWASAGAAAAHRVVNLVAVDAACAWYSVCTVGAGRAAGGTAGPAAASAAGAARAARAAVAAAGLRTCWISCRSLHSELCCSPAYFHHLHHNCPRAVPDALLLRACKRSVAQHAERMDEFCQIAVGTLHH